MKKDLPYWGPFLNNLKKTSKTDRNVGFKDVLTLEIPGNNSNFNFMYLVYIISISLEILSFQ